MENFKDLRNGMVVTYNDMANVDLQYIVLDKTKNEFGDYVNVMNLETKNIEPIRATTEIGKRWTLYKK
jgi:hypothetical protein